MLTSISEAYIGLIREANHCIYLENQFCEFATYRSSVADGPSVSVLDSAKGVLN